MGDRANVIIEYGEDGKIWFYSHWDGNGVVKKVHKALSSKIGRARWDDPAYLARIIFNYIQDDDRGETGYGISLDQCDNEHDHLVVDTANRRVKIEAAGNYSRADAGKSWSYEEFVALEKLPEI